MKNSPKTFKSFMKRVNDKDNNKLNKKTMKNKVFGGNNVLSPTEKANNRGDKVVMKSLLSEIVAMKYVTSKHEEEAETKPDKFAAARNIFNMMLHRPDMDRTDIIKAFQDKIGVTLSTATSYYQRLAKAAGITGPGEKRSGDNSLDDEQQKMSPIRDERRTDTDIEEEPQFEPETKWDDENKAGVIRTVPNAHLVYKRQQSDGSFEELWIFKIGDDFNKAFDVRKEILAGTDIPPNKTKSPDKSQSYTITTMGDGQMLSITGLPQ